MGRVISLDVALDRLLHKRSYRSAFLEGRFEDLDLCPEDREALEAIDRAELVCAAEEIRRDLWRRKHRGSGGLASLYPRTIAAWQAAHPEDGDLEELLSLFMESEAFDEHREVPFAGAGLSLEEAFFRFCEAFCVGEALDREDEFLSAIMKALLLSPSPDFLIPAAVRRAPGGFFAVRAPLGAAGGAPSAPILYAAVLGKLVTGPITPFLSELLLGTEPPEGVAGKHGVPPEALRASLERLETLGLLESRMAATPDP